MTSNTAAGFRAAPGPPSAASAPPSAAPVASLGTGRRGAPSSTRRLDAPGPEEKMREMEAEVHLHLERSASAGRDGDADAAFDAARECAKAERALVRAREKAGLADAQAPELTFAAQLNLAHRQHRRGQYDDALETYRAIAKNKQFPRHAGRVRVNMGNVHYERGDYPSAIKMYRMALDQVDANDSKETRFKIMRNIACAFSRMGQYVDAARTFQDVMATEPDLVSGFNLVVCHYAVGDVDAMLNAFRELLALRAYEPEEGEEEEMTGPGTAAAGGRGPPGEDANPNGLPGGDGGADAAASALRADALLAEDGYKAETRRRQMRAHEKIITAAKLIGPCVARTPERGYALLAEEMQSAGYASLAHELEMEKALAHLKTRRFTPGAFEEGKRGLRAFEKKDDRLRAKAATNLAFLYYQEGDVENAATYADLSVRANKYDARALVNRGVVSWRRGDVSGAQEMFEGAVRLEADCVEAVYNLGLVHKSRERYAEALAAFEKVRAMLPDSIEALFQLGNVAELTGDLPEAISRFEALSAIVPDDPGVLARLGAAHEKMGDEAKALQCYVEAHRVYPSNADVISWLGAFHVRREAYEVASPYFKLAADQRPSEPKWRLMEASCDRRAGKLAVAHEKYLAVHAEHPTNVECLRYLVHVCGDLALEEDVNRFTVKLRKAERDAGGGASTRAGPPPTLLGGLGGEEKFGGIGLGGANAKNRGGSRGGGVSSGTRVGDEGGLPLGARAPLAPVAEPPSPTPPTPSAPGGAASEDEWGGGELGDDLLPGM